MSDFDKPYVPGSLAASLTDTNVPSAAPVMTEEKPVIKKVLTKRKRKVEGISFESGLTSGKNRAKQFRVSNEEKERKQRIKKMKAKTSKMRLAVAGEDIFKKNKIKRDVAEDTAGNSYEQNLTDMLNKMNPGKEKAISKGLRNVKKNKGSFTI